MSRRLEDCTSHDWVKITTIHPDDADFVYELRITNINSGHFGANVESFRRQFASHMDSHTSGASHLLPSLVGRWRFTFSQGVTVS